MFASDDGNETIDVNETINATINATEPAVNDTIPPVNDTNTTNATVEPEYLDEEGIPAQVWDEDTTKTLNLTEYFQDPDNDELVFEHTLLEHVSVSVDEDGIATLIPDKNWHGTEFVRFTADDGKGGNVSSNTVRLTVNDAEEEPFMDRMKTAFSTYSNYVMVGVLILVILILLIEFRKPIMKFLEED